MSRSITPKRIAIFILLATVVVVVLLVDSGSSPAKRTPQHFYFKDTFDDVDEALAEFPLEAARLKQLKNENPDRHPGVSELLKLDLSRWTNIYFQGCDQAYVDVSSAIQHSGAYSFQSYCDFTVNATHKVFITKENLSFKKGDNFWLDAWYYVAAINPIDFMTLFDLESTGTELIPGIRTSPGIRFFIQGDQLGIQSGKWPAFNLTQTNLKFPKNTWVNIRLHLSLSDTSQGKLELWQNSIKIFDQNVVTLPKTDALYDKVQFGITAIEEGSNIVSVFVDDITISNKPF